MNKELVDYFKKHPEEYTDLGKLLARSERIQEGMKRRSKEKLRLIAECKRRLYGEQA